MKETTVPKCTTGELARFKGVSVDWLNTKTDNGLIDCERRANGRRYYDPIKAPQQVQAVIDEKK